MISVIVNTLNEEKNIKDCLESAKWADEIVIVDMHSDDRTVKIAQKYTNKIFRHKRVGYVEPARNFAIGKASGDWILILDADERVPKTLANKLKRIAKENSPEISVVVIPTRNIHFGKWIKHTGWWPDYHPRFFRKGKVRWSPKIHAGATILDDRVVRLPAEKRYALRHEQGSITDFISRTNRYTTIEAKLLKSEGETFSLKTALGRARKEFYTRYIKKEGYKDGIHGFFLSVLMFLYWFLVYAKLWEISGATPRSVRFREDEILFSVHKIKKTEAQIRNLEAEINEFKKNIGRLRNELNDIYSSKSWRVAKLLRTIAIWILKPFRAFGRK